MRTITLDCGHFPITTDGIGTGRVFDRDGRTYCYECADRKQREEMATGTNIYAYISSDGKAVTTWTGGYLANVTAHKSETRYTPTGGWFVRHYYWARENGRDWYGIGEGPGMFVRLKKIK